MIIFFILEKFFFLWIIKQKSCAAQRRDGELSEWKMTERRETFERLGGQASTGHGAQVYTKENLRQKKFRFHFKFKGSRCLISAINAATVECLNEFISHLDNWQKYISSPSHRSADWLTRSTPVENIKSLRSRNTRRQWRWKIYSKKWEFCSLIWIFYDPISAVRGYTMLKTRKNSLRNFCPLLCCWESTMRSA